MTLVTDQNGLNDICNKLAKEKILSIDTEFDRRNTYYAILSTIQITHSKQDIVIDVLSGVDLAPLKEIIYNEEILKIFHDSRQDLAIFNHHFGSIPNNIFDTQIASEICNISNFAISYSKLCKILLNVNINKALQAANWLKRPLTRDLLEYASSDTKHLEPLYKMMYNIINMYDLWNIYEIRLNNLKKNILCHDSPERIVEKMNIERSICPSIYKKLLILTEFREEYAKKQNIPRKYCAKDQDLLDICTCLLSGKDKAIALISRKRNVLGNKFANKLLEFCMKKSFI